MREIYEVIRIHQGKILFLEEHLDRLVSTSILVGISGFVDLPDIRKELKKVIRENPGREGNIKIVVAEGRLPWYEVKFTPHRYPSLSESARGVAVAAFNNTRLNPNAKVWNIDSRLSANEIIQKNKLFEVILVNEQGEATEGSRSNLFWVKQGTLYTTPHEMVLPGITRQKVIELALESGVPFNEKKILYDELSAVDEVFITGTSPGVLPVNKIDNHTITAPGQVTCKLKDAYLWLIEQIQK